MPLLASLTIVSDESRQIGGARRSPIRGKTAQTYFVHVQNFRRENEVNIEECVSSKHTPRNTRFLSF